MAGRGPAPKDPQRRARRNSDPVPLRIIKAEPIGQPELPRQLEILQDGMLIDFDWPEQTVEWWRMWRESPLSTDYTANDWSELLDTARIHALFWYGQTHLASELRLRVAKFGATPEDRARLRIQFAQADEAEEKAATPRPSSRTRRGPLRAVPKSSGR